MVLRSQVPASAAGLAAAGPAAAPRTRRSALARPLRWLAVAVAIAAACPSFAQETEPPDLAASSVARTGWARGVGFAGLTHLGRWTAIDLPGEELPGVVAAAAADPSGNRVLYPLQSRDGRLQGTVRLGRADGTLDLLDEAGVVVERIPLQPGLAGEPTPSDRVRVISNEVRYWAAVRADDAIAEAVLELNARPSNGVRIELLPLQASDVPSTAAALADVSLLLWNAPPPTAEQSRALQAWVADGGHLVVALDGDSDWAAAPLLDWAPLTVEPQRYRSLDVLQRAVPNARRINLPRGVEPQGWSIVPGEGGRELAGRLTVRAAYGFGTVTAFGLDLSLPPLQNWDGMTELHFAMAGRLPEGSTVTFNSQRAITRTGIGDLSTQVLAEVDRFGRSSAAVSVWTVLGWVALYALVVGPLDYVLVHKLLRRPQLTWLTMPLLVAGAIVLADRISQNAGVAATADASDTAAAAERPSSAASSPAASRNADAAPPVQTRQYDLVDVDATGPQPRLRRVQWAAAHVGPLGRYDFAALPWRTGSTLQTGWAVPLESNFGGLYHSGGLGFRSTTYRQRRDPSGPAGWPIDQRGGVFLETRETSSSAPAVAASLEFRARKLSGTLSHELQGSLVDWFVATGRSLVEPLDLKTPLRPGEPFRFDEKTVRTRGLRDRLLGLRWVEYERSGNDSYKNKATRIERDRYDPTGGDLLAATRTATFFEFLGGTEYATVGSHAPLDWDLTELLPLGRGIVVGRLQVPSPPLSDGQGQPYPSAGSDVFVRLLIPITVVDDE